MICKGIGGTFCEDTPGTFTEVNLILKGRVSFIVVIRRSFCLIVFTINKESSILFVITGGLLDITAEAIMLSHLQEL